MAGNSIAEMFVSIGADISGLKAGLDAAVKDTDSALNKIGKQLGSLVSIAALTGAAMKGIEFNKAAEQAQISFEVMTGSATKARETLAELRDFATKTPLEFADIRDATQTLVQFGYSADNAVKTVKMLGDVSGGNAQKLQSLSIAMGQISSAGKLQGQDLLQLINVGFNPLQEISKSTGKSMAELRKEMEKGAISADMVKESFKRATSEGGQFYQMMEKQGKTFAGSWSNFVDAVDQTLGKMTEGMMGPLKDAFVKLSETIMKMGQALSGIGDMFGGVITVVGNLLNGLASIIGGMPKEIIAIASALGIAKVAAIAFNVSLGPVGLAITGITAGLALMINHTQEQAKQQENLNKVMKDTTSITSDLRIETMKKAIEQKNLEIDNTRERLKRLRSEGNAEFIKIAEDDLRSLENQRAEYKSILDGTMLQVKLEAEIAAKKEAAAKAAVNAIEEEKAALSDYGLFNRSNEQSEWDAKLQRLKDAADAELAIQQGLDAAERERIAAIGAYEESRQQALFESQQALDAMLYEGEKAILDQEYADRIEQDEKLQAYLADSSRAAAIQQQGWRVQALEQEAKAAEDAAKKRANADEYAANMAIAEYNRVHDAYIADQLDAMEEQINANKERLTSQTSDWVAYWEAIKGGEKDTAEYSAEVWEESNKKVLGGNYDLIEKVRQNNKIMTDLYRDMVNKIQGAVTDAAVIGFETIGKALFNSSKAGEDFLASMQKIGAQLLHDMSDMFIAAGLKVIINNPDNWPAAVALLALGGVSGIASGFVGSKQTNETVPVADTSPKLAGTGKMGNIRQGRNAVDSAGNLVIASDEAMAYQHEWMYRALDALGKIEHDRADELETARKMYASAATIASINAYYDDMATRQRESGKTGNDASNAANSISVTINSPKVVDVGTASAIMVQSLREMSFQGYI